MNPLLAAIKGTGKTVSDSTESTLQAAKNAVIPPNVAYSLGMGIGPWLRNVANATEKKDDKKDAKKSEAGGLAKKEFTLLSTQFNTMVSILRDIRNIGMTQLRADQQRMIEARRQEYFNKEAASESAGILGASITGTDRKDGKSSLAVLGEMMPAIFAMLAGGAVAGGIWNYIFDDKTRENIKKSLFGEKGVWTTIADKYVEVLKSNPVETALGTLVAARVTGALAALGFATKFVYHGGKLIGEVGGKVGDVMAPGQRDKSGAGRAGLQAAVEAAELSQLSRPNITSTGTPLPSTEGGSNSKLNAARRAAYSPAAEAAEAEAAANAAAKAAEATKATGGMLTKITPLLTSAGKWMSRSMIGIGAGVSAFSAAEDYKEGKTFAAVLNGLSATLGVGALGALAIPGAGPVVSGTLAVGSALTGMIGAAASYFSEGKSKDQRAVNTVSPSATNVARNSNAKANIPAEEIMGIIQTKFAGAGYGANQTWAALANAARESGFVADAHNGNGEDSWGIFQMNRRNGLGAGHTPQQLSDPNYNTELLLANLRAAENRNDYFGNEARMFRDATTKEEAAEHLRRFLFGNGTASQQMAGMAKQTEINSAFESGRYGRVPDITSSSSFAQNASSGAASPSLPSLSPSNVTSRDASSGGILGEMTQLAQDMNRLLAGGLMMASNDTNTTINNANMSGGGTPSPRIDTSLIQQTTQHVAP